MVTKMTLKDQEPRVQYLIWRIRTDSQVLQGLRDAIKKNQEELDQIYLKNG